MPRTHAPYPAEFRQRMVELVRAGRSPEDLSREFEPSAQAIRNWVRQVERGAGSRNADLTTDERKELDRLRGEVETLRREKELLSRAALWFAQEAGRQGR